MGGRLIDIGRIVAPHGVKGEFRIAPMTDFPERFLDMKSLSLYDGKSLFRRELEIESIRIRPDKKDILVKTLEIENRTQAEDLRGLFVKIPPDQRVELDDDEFWIDDLMGLSVVESETGREIGVLCDVMSTGGGDVYSVRPSSGKVFMIPAARKYVLSVDIKKGVMTVQAVRELMNL